MASSHRLAAIMFTDVAGYTALMARDETHARQLLHRFHEVSIRCHEQFNGEVVNDMGDGCMSLFTSALEAVQCAIEMQRALKNEEPKVPLRIGLHLGEVARDESGLYGNAVNIASRIESIGYPGAILVSDRLYQELSNRSDLHFQSMGKFKLKNVPQSLEVYAVANEGIFVPAPDKLSGKGSPVPETVSTRDEDQVSIAVLPFENMSADADQEYFCDGMSDEVITDLSRLKNLLVISRSSSAHLKGTNLDTRAISEKLGVQYLLTGGVRRAGDRLRITAQLVDAWEDRQVWADKFNGSLEDVFQLQEDISRRIVSSLNLQLSSREDRRLKDRPIGDIRAYEAYLLAYSEFTRFSKASLDRAMQLIDSAMEIIGPNVLLLSTKGQIYLRYIILGISPDPGLVDEAEDCLHQLVDMSPASAERHLLEGMIRFRQVRIQEAADHFKQALSYDPKNRDVLLFLCVIYILAGHGDAAEAFLDDLLAVDPLNSSSHMMPGYIKASRGDLSGMVPHYRRAYEVDSANPFIVYMYGFMNGRILPAEEVCSVLDRLETLAPTHTHGRFAKFLKLALRQQRTEALKAGQDEQIRKAATNDEHAAWWMACIYAIMDEKKEALYWLEQAVELGYRNYPFLATHDPYLENIRGEKRFLDLMKRVRIYWETFQA
jgi:TolB-like protein/class 3 adenylate cyclase